MLYLIMLCFIFLIVVLFVTALQTSEFETGEHAVFTAQDEQSENPVYEVFEAFAHYKRDINGHAKNSTLTAENRMDTLSNLVVDICLAFQSPIPEIYLTTRDSDLLGYYTWPDHKIYFCGTTNDFVVLHEIGHVLFGLCEENANFFANEVLRNYYANRAEEPAKETTEEEAIAIAILSGE